MSEEDIKSAVSDELIKEEEDAVNDELEEEVNAAISDDLFNQEDAVKKVVVLGLKSSGKSYIANAIAGEKLFPATENTHTMQLDSLTVKVID